MKKLLALIPIAMTALYAFPAHAGRVEPTPVTCWFLRGERVELQQTCTYEMTSWAGGGGYSLLWEDGVKTRMAWGLQGRGERPCKETSVDGVCGIDYFRDPTTLERISKDKGEQLLRNEQHVVVCVQVKLNSVCRLR